MRIKLDAAITTLLVSCAVITTGIVIRREFVAPAAAPGEVEQKPLLIPHWRDDLEKGVRMGPSQAPVELIEFADFECPYCGDFHKKVKALRERYPTQIALIYVQFPLPGHRFAVPAARAAECAREQGRFEAMYDRLFEEQDSFGLKPWSEFAAEAGVPDGGAFETCIKRNEPIPRVLEGEQLGKDRDVQGTPTVIINGWKLGHPPSETELDAMVKAILAGKDPFSGVRKS